MKKIQKKAFTLVELLVVIAILAVLATVAILGYSSFTNKANQSNDATVVAELNRFTQAYIAGGGEVNTVTDIANELEKDGFKLSTIKTSYKKDYYAFDVEKHEFSVVLEKENNALEAGNPNQFVFVKSETELQKANTAGYSAYLQEEFDKDVINTSKGVDVGVKNNITSINYTNPGEHQEVVIRTNSYDTALTVNAPLDTIHHYGSLMSANLQKVSSSSYYEHGDTNLVEIASGRLVITNDAGANVDTVYLTATDDNYKVAEVGIIIATQTGAKLPATIKRDAVTETDGKAVCTIQTNVDANGENPQKVDNVTIKGEDNVQEATNGYTNVADLTKMVLEAPVNTEGAGADYIDNNIAVSSEDKEAIINEAKGTVIEVTFKGEKTQLTISEFRDQWNAGAFFEIGNPASVKLTGNVDMKKIGNWGPIGTWEYPFFGTFDGNNMTISNLSNHANADAKGNYTHVYSIGNSIGYGESYGFFGIIGGGDTTIQNVTFKDVDIDVENGKNIGAVIGYAPKNSDFYQELTAYETEDSNHKKTYDGKYFASEPTGKFVDSENVTHYYSTKNPNNSSKWKNNNSIGTHTLTLNSVTVSGSVKGKSHIGGLVGKDYSSGALTLTNCTSEAVVSANASGGLSAFVAYINGPSSATFDSCSTTENSKLIALTSNVNSIGDLYGFCKISAVITGCTSYTKLELPENFAITGTTTITMYSDCIVKDVTFTSNSYELGIYGNMTLKNCVIQTKNFRNYRNGNLTIEDSTVNVGFENYGTTTIKSGTFNIPVTNWLGGTMTIEDGSFTKSDGSGSVISNYGSLTITGYTTITNTKDSSYNDKITNQEDTTTHTIGTLTIGNGEAITSGGPHSVLAVKISE